MMDKVSESLSMWSLDKARDDIKSILNNPCWDNPQPVTSEEWITDKMNSEDKLWELAKLEYKRDEAKNSCDAVEFLINIEMNDERHRVELNNIGKDYKDWEKLNYANCFSNHKEEMDRRRDALDLINAQISKLLKDET